jgi:uncharacterized protein (DUF2141 family)
MPMILPALLLAASPVPVAAQTSDCTGKPSATRLYVDVSNVRDARGLIAVTLYADNPKKFLAKRGSLYVGRVPARAGTTRVCIHLPTPGTYAVAVYHDEDANRKLNRKGIGTPAEGYGFSNNASTLFGLPSFRSVRLSAPRSGLQTSIRLKYP